jgi:hypothetical protein
MTLNPATYSTRSLSFVMLAAFAGVALWLFAPLGQGGSGSSGGSTGAGAAMPSSIRVDGAVQVESHDNVVTRLVVPLAIRGDQGIAFDDGAKLRAETAMADTASAAVPATFDIAWTDGNGDRVLDAGEHAMMTVALPSWSTVHPDNPLRLVLKTPGGSTLAIEDVLGR